VDLNESLTPHFFLMDGILGMEGHGPGQGTPFRTGVLVGSSNPLALDIIASTIAGYHPKDIPTSRIALARGIWLKSADEINCNGPVMSLLIRKDFKRIPVTPDNNVSFKFIKDRIRFLRKFERRPVFIHNNCTGCNECIKICPKNAIKMDRDIKNYVVLTDKKCIRCFCCSEVCKFKAVKIRVKIFGE
jgi:ferredoxin